MIFNLSPIWIHFKSLFKVTTSQPSDGLDVNSSGKLFQISNFRRGKGLKEQKKRKWTDTRIHKEGRIEFGITKEVH